MKADTYSAAREICAAWLFNAEASALQIFREHCADNGQRFTWQAYEAAVLAADSLWCNYREGATC